MALKVHLIVQDSTDFHDPASHDAIQEKVATVTAVPSHMERPEAGHDVVSRSGSGHVGAFREFADGLQQSVTIDRGLSRPEILGCPLEDVCEIDFSDNAETNAPLLRDHGMSVACA